MKKLFILLAAVLTGLVAQAQTDVTMVDNIGDYTGSDAYVYNKADGKVYVKNNLGDYERYGVYPKVATLKVAGGGDTDIDYIATTDNMSNMPYINTGYTHKADTRVVVDYLPDTPVAIVGGSPLNMKVTTKDDMPFAAVIADEITKAAAKRHVRTMFTQALS